MGDVERTCTSVILQTWPYFGYHVVLRSQSATKDEAELIYVSSIIPIHLVNASEAEGSREVACQPCSPSLGWPRPCLPSVTSSRNLERLIAHLFTHRCNRDKPYMLNDQLRKSDPTDRHSPLFHIGSCSTCSFIPLGMAERVSSCRLCSTKRAWRC